MLNVIGALIALGILIIVHETGHFIVARIVGVEIEKFSIGFGPRLFGFKKNKTEYRISLIPLGGYIKMKGENPNEEVDDTTGSYHSKSWWERGLIAFAGPFANFLFALIIFIASFAIGRYYEDHLPVVGKVEPAYEQIFEKNDTILEINGHTVQGWSQIVQYSKQDEINSYLIEREGNRMNLDLDRIEPETWYSEILPLSPSVIGEVAPGMPAYQAGLMAGDSILAVNGEKVNDWYEMRELITGNVSDEITLSIKRGEQTFEKSLILEENIFQDNKIIGITQYMPVKIEEHYNIVESVAYGSITTVNFVALNYVMLFKLVTKPKAIKSNLGGPIMIYTMSKQTISKGWNYILSFIGAISIILMIMNLLPIPVLDGGHIFFCFIEGIQKKPLSQRLQIAFQNIGIFILLFLMVFAFWNDISRIFTRNVAIHEQKMNME
jgi:regulator of sigma E protease